MKGYKQYKITKEDFVKFDKIDIEFVCPFTFKNLLKYIFRKHIEFEGNIKVKIRDDSNCYLLKKLK